MQTALSALLAMGAASASSRNSTTSATLGDGAPTVMSNASPQASNPPTVPAPSTVPQTTIASTTAKPAALTPAAAEMMRSNADPALVLHLIKLLGQKNQSNRATPPVKKVSNTTTVPNAKQGNQGSQVPNASGMNGQAVHIPIASNPNLIEQQTTRSGRISRPPPVTTAPSSSIHQSTNLNNDNHHVNGSNQGSNGLGQGHGQGQDSADSVEAIAQVNMAILQNLLGTNRFPSSSSSLSHGYSHNNNNGNGNGNRSAPSNGASHKLSSSSAMRRNLVQGIQSEEIDLNDSGNDNEDGNENMEGQKNAQGGPGPGTIASRNKKRTASSAGLHHDQHSNQTHQLDQTNHSFNHQRDTTRRFFNDLNTTNRHDTPDSMDPEFQMSENDSLQDPDPEADADQDADGDRDHDGDQDQEEDGDPPNKKRRGYAPRLTAEEALRRRKERNKKAAKMSRDAKKNGMAMMEIRLKGLEGEHALLLNKYNVLEQRYTRIKQDYFNLQETHKAHVEASRNQARSASTTTANGGSKSSTQSLQPTSSSTSTSTDPPQNTITINGISLNLDHYLALSSLRPRSVIARALAQKQNQNGTLLGQDGDGDGDEDEDEDGDFNPSSPVRGGDDDEEVEEEEEGGGDVEEETNQENQGENEGETANGETSSTPDGSAPRPTEQTSPAGDQEEDGEGEYEEEDDDDHFEDEDMDDEELFLPIEDVPIPEGEQEAIEARYRDKNMLNVSSETTVGGGQGQRGIAGVGALQAATGLDENALEEAALFFAQLTGNANVGSSSQGNLHDDGLHHQPQGQDEQADHGHTQVHASHPAENDHLMEEPMHSSPRLTLADPVTCIQEPQQELLTGNLISPVIGRDPIAAKALLDAYAAVANNSGPDRGYGLGRGEQRDLDPTALMRQIMILAQSQHNQNL